MKHQTGYLKSVQCLFNVITNTIINTVDIGHKCWGTDFNMNRLAIRAIQNTTSYIVYLDPNGKLIDRVNIPGRNKEQQRYVSPYQPHKHFYVYLRQFLLVLVGRFRL
jgi:hypothetical protein